LNHDRALVRIFRKNDNREKCETRESKDDGSDTFEAKLRPESGNK
jgi:hypothetical protein